MPLPLAHIRLALAEARTPRAALELAITRLVLVFAAGMPVQILMHLGSWPRLAMRRSLLDLLGVCQSDQGSVLASSGNPNVPE